jgi:hypothetical protein
MGLNEPFRGVGLADPDSDGVVVVVFHLGVVFGAAVESVDYMISSKGRVWAENANLEVAEFVGLELAVPESDEYGVRGLDLVVYLDEVFGEEAADCSEISFCHGGPEILFEIYDLYRGRSCVLGLRWRSQDQECDKKEIHEGYISAGLG